MSALILCTPSISKTRKLSALWGWGLSLPQSSYWRTRTVLGRVLGALPGVKSLNGWIGPGPAVEFVPPIEIAVAPRHIQLNAQLVHALWYENLVPGAPLPSFGAEDNSVLFADEDITEPGPYDGRDPWQAQMSNNNFWMVPITPGRHPTNCELKSIQLEQIPIEQDPTNLLPKWLQGVDVDFSIQCMYRASLIFQLSTEKHSVRYTINTNPVFVTPPPCSSLPHHVHMQAFALRYSNTYTVDKLRYEQPPAVSQPDRPFVVNAMGKGEELLARAWCAQWGRNAVVRKEGGPCFACAVRSARKSGLGFGVLIRA
jgi:hypothetical protein